MSHFTKIFTYLVTLSCYVCTKRPIIMIRLNFKNNYLTTDIVFSKIRKKTSIV